MIPIPESKYIRGLIRKSRILHDKSSLPFISGNSYKSMCATELTDQFEDFFKSEMSNSRVFISVGNLYHLIKWLRSNQLVTPREETLVVHNGDVIPPISDYYFLKGFFHKVFSVNWLGDSSVVEPLPIGLENQSFVQNGIPRDFRKSILKIRHAWEERPIEILIAFNNGTNDTERFLARSSAKSIACVLETDTMISPKNYRKLLSSSKYVLSPPGNGPDCHRTWEALYLGAIPIVKRDFWNFEVLRNNVVVLDSWEDISTYRDLQKKPLDSPVNDLMQLFVKRFCR
jgi:hypothetical protein